MAEKIPAPIPVPSKFPWPPVLLVLGLLVAVLLNRIAPVPWPNRLDNSLFSVLGFLVLGAGLGLEIWTITYFGKNKSNVLPTREADKLLTEGPFALSRNPIYLGNVLLIFSFAALFRNPWFAVTALAVLIATGRLAVAREEKHLAAKFGPKWNDYRTNVRRWL